MEEVPTNPFDIDAVHKDTERDKRVKSGERLASSTSERKNSLDSSDDDNSSYTGDGKVTTKHSAPLDTHTKTSSKNPSRSRSRSPFSPRRGYNSRPDGFRQAPRNFNNRYSPPRGRGGGGFGSPPRGKFDKFDNLERYWQ